MIAISQAWIDIIQSVSIFAIAAGSFVNALVLYRIVRR